MTPAGFYVLAVVASVALVSFESLVARRRDAPRPPLETTLVDVSHFVGELTLTALLHLNLFAGYQAVEGRFALVAWDPRSPVTWIAAVIALDLVYWVGHVACHRVGVLWALHAVHHGSRQMDFAAGIRGPWLSALQIAPFALPLLLLGFPSDVLFVVYAAHTAWKMLVHTTLIGRLGPLEGILATPSQHRVHHGLDERYLDRNFGGLLSIWDRLFGTFQAEEAAPTYAPSTPVATHDPLAQNLAPWRDLAATARAHGWLAALLGPPRTGSQPGGAAVRRAAAAPARRPGALRAAIVGTFVACAAGALALTMGAVDPSGVAGWALGAAIVAGLSTMGRLVDRAMGESVETA